MIKTSRIPGPANDCQLQNQMISRTQAIVLRYYPIANTSRVVIWLTMDAGRISTMIKGSLRPKSMFLGQYDQFYTCELLYYTRSTRQLHIARECSPIKWRPELRRNWKASAGASYFADLYFRLSPPGAHHAGLFILLEKTLDDLNVHGVLEPVIFWFELQLLSRLGLAPQLKQCLRCNREIISGLMTALFSNELGGILCASCANISAEQSAVIPPDVLNMLLSWQSSDSARICRSTRCTAPQLASLDMILRKFIEFHLGISPASRQLALNVLRRNP